ncbi:MAG: hypothetical protein HQL78_00495 [Magnetococcales bacterium]|nr:hypothetical protein [Magnetococcales bacterium]
MRRCLIRKIQDCVIKASYFSAVFLVIFLIVGCSRNDDFDSDGKIAGEGNEFPNLTLEESNQGVGEKNNNKDNGFVYIDTGQGMIIKNNNGYHAPKISIVFDVGVSDSAIANVFKRVHVQGAKVNDCGHGKSYIGTTAATSREELQQTILELSNMPEVLSVR